MKQLMIFGDSIVKGVTYYDAGYHLCKEHNFDALTRQGISVSNFAKMGACTDTGLKIAEKRLAPCGPDTTILLAFGGNDCDFDWQAISENPEGTFLPKTPEPQFVENYRRLIALAQKTGARVAMLSLVPLESHRFMQHVSAGRSFDNILRWLGDIDRISRWQEYYNDMVCQLARSLGCQLIDLRAEFLKSPSFLSLISDDGIHPTQQGHDLVHSCVSRALAAT